jgi:hypothetical protein
LGSDACELLCYLKFLELGKAFSAFSCFFERVQDLSWKANVTALGISFDRKIKWPSTFEMTALGNDMDDFPSICSLPSSRMSVGCKIAFRCLSYAWEDWPIPKKYTVLETV